MNFWCDQWIDYISVVIKVVKMVIVDFDFGFNVEIYGCFKYIYFVYCKMVIQYKQFFQIYDLLVIWVVVDLIKDCYVVLGVIYIFWILMLGWFKDYIVMLKVNGY